MSYSDKDKSLFTANIEKFVDGQIATGRVRPEDRQKAIQRYRDGINLDGRQKVEIKLGEGGQKLPTESMRRGPQAFVNSVTTKQEAK